MTLFYNAPAYLEISGSQLPLRGLRRFLVHLPVQCRTVGYFLPILPTLPPKRQQPLRQNRMTVMITSIHPIGIHGAQILHLQFNQTPCQLPLIPQPARKLISFEFKLAGEDVHAEFDDTVEGGEGVGEEDEADDYGLGAVEVETGVEGCVGDEGAEEEEDVQHVELASPHEHCQHRGRKFGETYLCDSE
jgi:hypothetical protein